MLTLKKIHLCVALSLAALLVWPVRVVSGANRPPGTYTNRATTPAAPGSRTEGQQQDPISAQGLTGRSGASPICVALSERFRSSRGFFDFRYFYVEIPQGSSLKCSLSGGLEGQTYLSMYAYTSNQRFCTISSSNQSLECNIEDGSEIVEIYVEYFGPQTTIDLVCNNEPCTEAECGDDFCSDGFETPQFPGGATESTCLEDCGRSCGDGECDAENGEDDTNCFSDCFICAVVDETLDLNYGENVEYQIEV